MYNEYYWFVELIRPCTGSVVSEVNVPEWVNKSLNELAFAEVENRDGDLATKSYADSMRMMIFDKLRNWAEEEYPSWKANNLRFAPVEQ